MIQPSVGFIFPSHDCHIYQDHIQFLYRGPVGEGGEIDQYTLRKQDPTPRGGAGNTLLGPGELVVSKRSVFDFREGQQNRRGAVDYITGCQDHVGGGWMDCLPLGFSRHSGLE